MYRGGFEITASDSVPNLGNDQPASALVLFGNAGSSLWAHFSTSTEYHDEKDDPLNRWSERIGHQLAEQFAGNAHFPFGGPPFQPFLQWAKKTEALASSEIGMLIHPEYGLWHAYRFAIALPNSAISCKSDRALLTNLTERHACDTCSSQACLSACPVNAFTEDNYDLEACFQYLDNTPSAQCHQRGCQARTACPEGKNYLYEKAHAAFHMQQFVKALRRRSPEQALKL